MTGMSVPRSKSIGIAVCFSDRRISRRKTEQRINSFESFKANIASGAGDATDVHFIALRSAKENAIPVVLLHGWPGSPLEFLGLLENARAKYGTDELPYTFIVPSLPGYGFSSGPSLQTESTCESMAEVINSLMLGLGFGSGYIAQGGDIGSFVARILAARHGACKAAHSKRRTAFVLRPH